MDVPLWDPNTFLSPTLRWRLDRGRAGQGGWHGSKRVGKAAWMAARPLAEA